MPFAFRNCPLFQIFCVRNPIFFACKERVGGSKGSLLRVIGTLMWRRGVAYRSWFDPPIGRFSRRLWGVRLSLYERLIGLSQLRPSICGWPIAPWLSSIISCSGFTAVFSAVMFPFGVAIICQMLCHVVPVGRFLN